MRLRLTFSKQGALRYTGHLDLHNLWERAARRAGLPLAYSQGFHPQPKIQLASALPLGFSSRAEVMDIWLTSDSEVSRLRNDLQSALPADIQILDLQAIDDRAPKLQTQVVSAEYEATLSEEIPNLDEKIAALLRADSLPRERRGKRYDLRPLIESLALTPGPSPKEHGRGESTFSYPPLPESGEGFGVRVFMRLAARESATGRPEEVLAALGIPLESARIERTRLLFL
ncbi:MAG: TIGR03936 family radical SAM-associated protein, partial [Chloroflexota bacterium]